MLAGNIPASTVTAVDSHMGKIVAIERWSKHFDELGSLVPIETHTSVARREIRFIQKSEMSDWDATFCIQLHIFDQVVGISLLPVSF